MLTFTFYFINSVWFITGSNVITKPFKLFVVCSCSSGGSVMFHVLSFCFCDLHAFCMEPFLTNIVQHHIQLIVLIRKSVVTVEFAGDKTIGELDPNLIIWLSNMYTCNCLNVERQRIKENMNQLRQKVFSQRCSLFSTEMFYLLGKFTRRQSLRKSKEQNELLSPINELTK